MKIIEYIKNWEENLLLSRVFRDKKNKRLLEKIIAKINNNSFSINNAALFDYLNDPEEDIYTAQDGETIT